MRRVAGILAVLAVAAFLVGCGGGGNYSTPKDTFTSMWSAAKAGNEDAMVACFVKDMRDKWPELRKVTKEMMAVMGPEAGDMDMMKMMQDEAKKAPPPEFGAEKIDGDKATLEVTLEITHTRTSMGPDGKATKTEEKKKEKESIQFVKESDGWKMKFPGEMPDVEQMKKSLEQLKAMKGMAEKLKGKGMEDATEKMKDMMK
jgi:hypothetical protein